MPKIGPIRRTELIAAFRRLGFSGPYAGGKHQFMLKGPTRVILPNPHQREIGTGLLVRILREANISRDEWESA